MAYLPNYFAPSSSANHSYDIVLMSESDHLTKAVSLTIPSTHEDKPAPCLAGC